MSIQSFDKNIIDTKNDIDSFKNSVVSDFHEQSLGAIDELITNLEEEMKKPRSLKGHTINKKEIKKEINTLKELEGKLKDCSPVGIQSRIDDLTTKLKSKGGKFNAPDIEKKIQKLKKLQSINADKILALKKKISEKLTPYANTEKLGGWGEDWTESKEWVEKEGADIYKKFNKIVNEHVDPTSDKIKKVKDSPIVKEMIKKISESRLASKENELKVSNLEKSLAKLSELITVKNLAIGKANLKELNRNILHGTR